jgi:hypothetical protein
MNSKMLMLIMLSLVALRATSTFSAKAGNANEIVIFDYHQITSNNSIIDSQYVNNMSSLINQLTWLKENNYTTITMNTLDNYMINGTPVPQKDIVLTFSDGWKSHAYLVAPLLKQYGDVATFYVIAKGLVNSSYIGPFSYPYSTCTPSPNYTLADVQNDLNPNETMCANAYMNMSDALTLQNVYHDEIGGHTYNHFDLVNASNNPQDSHFPNGPDGKANWTLELNVSTEIFRDNGIIMTDFNVPYCDVPPAGNDTFQNWMAKLGYVSVKLCMNGFSNFTDPSHDPRFNYRSIPEVNGSFYGVSDIEPNQTLGANITLFGDVIEYGNLQSLKPPPSNTTTSTSTTTTTTTIIYPAVNQSEVNKMITSFKPTDFTNITFIQSIANITAPAAMFKAYDPQAYSATQGGYVLMFALPQGYRFTNLVSLNQYKFATPQNAVGLGNINYNTIPANDFFPGPSNGNGSTWINWKEIIPDQQFQSLVNPNSITTSTTTSSTTIPTTTTIAPLKIAAPTPKSQNVLSGNTVTITDAGATGGSGNYIYQWMEEQPAANSFTNAIDCANPTVTTCTFATTSMIPTGNYIFELMAIDSALPANSVVSTNAVVIVISSTTVSSTTTTVPTTSTTTSLVTTLPTTSTSTLSTTTKPTTSATTSTAVSTTTTVAATNKTVQSMESALKSSGFTNVSTTENVAKISSPGIMFIAFDSNAYGSGKGGKVLVFAVPLGYEFKNWSNTDPAVYDYSQPSNVLKTVSGTIAFNAIPGNSFTPGTSSGSGTNWINWKELVPATKYQSKI